jgi:hypothetical protein
MVPVDVAGRGCDVVSDTTSARPGKRRAPLALAAVLVALPLGALGTPRHHWAAASAPSAYTRNVPIGAMGQVPSRPQAHPGLLSSQDQA